MSGDPGVVVEPDLCMGSGYCRHAAPEVFGSSQDGSVIVDLGGAQTTGPVRVPPDLAAAVAEAESYCPAVAIRMVEL